MTTRSAARSRLLKPLDQKKKVSSPVNKYLGQHTIRLEDGRLFMGMQPESEMDFHTTEFWARFFSLLHLHNPFSNGNNFKWTLILNRILSIDPFLFPPDSSDLEELMNAQVCLYQKQLFHKISHETDEQLFWRLRCIQEVLNVMSTAKGPLEFPSHPTHSYLHSQEKKLLEQSNRQKKKNSQKTTPTKATSPKPASVPRNRRTRSSSSAPKTTPKNVVLPEVEVMVSSSLPIPTQYKSANLPKVTILGDAPMDIKKSKTKPTITSNQTFAPKESIRTQIDHFQVVIDKQELHRFKRKGCYSCSDLPPKKKAKYLSELSTLERSLESTLAMASTEADLEYLAQLLEQTKNRCKNV